jgi:hypothetical protein
VTACVSGFAPFAGCSVRRLLRWGAGSLCGGVCSLHGGGVAWPRPSWWTTFEVSCGVAGSDGGILGGRRTACGNVSIFFNGVRHLSHSLCVVMVLFDVDSGFWGGATRLWRVVVGING